MADKLWLQIGLPPNAPTATAGADETIVVGEVVDALLQGGSISRTPHETVAVGELVTAVALPPPPPPPGGDFVQAPTTGGSFIPGGKHPSAYQLLGLGSLPAGWHARSITHVNPTPTSPKTSYRAIVRNRGSQTDYETLDMRGMKIFWHANNQTPVDLYSVGNSSGSNTSCGKHPAVVGSYAKSATDFTPKAQVFRLYGLDHRQTVSGTDAQVPSGLTSMTPVPQFDSTSDNTWSTWKHDDADGVVGAWAHPGRPSVLAYWSGAGDFNKLDQSWVVVDGVWCRDMMDGFSSYGSAIEMRNSFVQRNHDDIHWMGNDTGPTNVTAPVYAYKNFYWHYYQGVSYLESNNPVTAGGEFTTFDACILALTRELPYIHSSVDTQAMYDNHAHATVMKYRSAGGTNIHPKMKFLNGTVVLMLGRAEENGLVGINCPVGSFAAGGSHFIYYDMGHNSGDQPPTFASGSSSFLPNQGAQSIKDTFGAANYHVVNGADLSGGHCTTAGHTDIPMRDYFWPAVQDWIDEHPQYFCATPSNYGSRPQMSLSTSNSWATNKAILDNAN